MNDAQGRPRQYEVVWVQRWFCAWCQVNGPWNLALDLFCPNCHRQRDAYSTISNEKQYREVS